jgi:biotin synthase
MSQLLESLAQNGLQGEAPTSDELLALLALDDDQLLDIVSAAFQVRRTFFGRRVKLNTLINMKSGLCPEDCGYCSQRKGSDTGALKYTWISDEEAAENAKRAVAVGAKRVCLVASGRGPSDRDLDRIAGTIDAVKEIDPSLEVCVCLGLLKEGQAERLRDAGAFAYNHNLNTNEDNYGKICSTHTYEDRVDTVNHVSTSGLSPCSGAIVGMGETDEDIVKLAFALRELNPDSVPINFLMPFDGTPLANTWNLTPARCLKILALFRFVFPDVEVRAAGGRETHLRSMQPLMFYIANSVFLGDYLTSEGQPGAADLQMIRDAGFTVEGMEEQTLPEPQLVKGEPVTLRRRGAGTSVPSNI